MPADTPNEDLSPGGGESGNGNNGYSYEAYRILQLGFVAAPILAGADKFAHLLVDWTKYLAPFLAEIVGAGTFMGIAGLVEIVAGIGVALKPRIFSYVVAIWLAGIILNLILVGGYLDVALRDLGLMIGAIALGRLSHKHASD